MRLSELQKRDVTAGSSRGLACPQCGSAELRVIYLKRLPGGVLMRRRECKRCGHRLRTREQVM